MFKNTASQSVTLYAFNATTGVPVTGDAANLLFYVSLDDGAVTLITANSGVPTEVDATNAKGLYKIALAQAETNANKELFSGKSATANVYIVPAIIYTIPSAFGIAGGAAGGVFIAGTNAATVVTTSFTTTFTGSLTGSVASVTGAVGSVTARVTANTDQLGGQTVTASGGIAFQNGTVATTTNITAGTLTTVTNLTNAPTAGDFTATMKTSLNAATPASVGTVTGNVNGNVGGNVTGSVGSVVAGVTLSATGSATLTEGYRANGAAGTLPQLLYEIVAHLSAAAIVGTTKTINRVDNITPAETFALDSATAPTSIIRAT